MAALTLPTPQYSTGTWAASNTPAHSAARAATTSVGGKAGSGVGLIVNGRTQWQSAPGIVGNDSKVDQHRKRSKLVAGAFAEFSGSGQGASRRQHIVDQHQSSLPAL